MEQESTLRDGEGRFQTGDVAVRSLLRKQVVETPRLKPKKQTIKEKAECDGRRGQR